MPGKLDVPGTVKFAFTIYISFAAIFNAKVGLISREPCMQAIFLFGWQSMYVS